MAVVLGLVWAYKLAGVSEWKCRTGFVHGIGN